MPRYNPAEIEPKWQSYWENNATFRCPDMPVGEKLYVLDMFPYPSGAGLHVGHPEGYTATDIVCRAARMQGKTVLHPMGYDAFGLPAEEHAIRTNTPPRVSTEANIANFTRQLKMLGFSYDWSRVLATTDRDYFRWTQWIFLLIYDTWFDAKTKRGRPINELPIPDDVKSKGDEAIRRYQDQHRLAYQEDALVNWCPKLGTVLANEEVKDGRSDVGGHPVQRIPLRQWMLRITAYADRLIDDLEPLDWPEGIKKLQHDWIGRSRGAEVDFHVKSEISNLNEPLTPDPSPRSGARGVEGKVEGSPRSDARGVEFLRVYTTRPDTLFGATYMVIAPEHPMVQQLTTSEQRASVEAYVTAASFKSDRDRTEGTKKKTGVFTGSYATNPVNGASIPIWIADYVLAGYGTGAIMAVPAHDERDYEFAKTFDLPIIEVVQSKEPTEPGTCYSGDGIAIASGKYTGLTTAQVKQQITQELEQSGMGRASSNTKLRDWLFSRQRFWGEPFPILHELGSDGKPNGLRRTVDATDLPVDLPELEDFKPHGRPEPPLMKATEWLNVTIDGKHYIRETNTMPQWAGSCWYYLRYIDPKNGDALIDREKEQAWMPIDLYVGGAEHAVLHLLYSRFWHKVLFDRGVVSTSEPFRKLVNQGMILGEVEYTAYQDDAGNYYVQNDINREDDGSLVTGKAKTIVKAISLSEDQVVKKGEGFILATREDVKVDARSFKMSKSRGNVVNPDEVVKQYGADSLRLYEMFMGPLEATKPWNMNGVSGVRGFIERLWRLIVDERSEQTVLNAAIIDRPCNREEDRIINTAIQAITRDVATLGFNTAIARMMETVNFFTKNEDRPKSAMEKLVLLLSPFAPHVAEELWQVLGHRNTLAYEPWPVCDAAALKLDTIEIPVQVNGKVRSKINVAPDADAAMMESVALSDPRVAELLEGKTLVKKVVVPGRMVNLVVK
jgi:leucyl-tRNA synthetase